MRLGLRAGKGLVTEVVGTTHCTGAPPDCDPRRAIVGILVKPATQIDAAVPGQIDTGRSAARRPGSRSRSTWWRSSATTSTAGYKVAATGELDLDGSVSPIGGVKQKTIGVRHAGVDVFLVPAGDNAKEARKYAGPVRVIPVESFRQALQRAGNVAAKAKK